MGVALFEASSLERAELVADEAVAAGPDRVRLRGEVERERMRAYRHPDSVDPAASLVVAEDAAVALEALGDDVGVARARYLMCELAWLQGSSERGLREAREALRFARRGRRHRGARRRRERDRLGARGQPRAGTRRAGRVR